MADLVDDDDFPPALEDAEIDDADIDEDDISSDASVVTDSSNSVSVDSDTLEATSTYNQSTKQSGSMAFEGDGEVVIHRFNKLLDHGIEEGDEDAEDSSDEENEADKFTGDQKRRRGVAENGQKAFTAALGGPIIVPLKSGSRKDDADFVSPGAGQGRRLGRKREEALERNMIRRQSSNEMLQAMRNATKTNSESASSDVSEAIPATENRGRKPPPRTKSGDGFQRRPPPRTKSGEGPVEDIFQRKPPARMKSGESNFERRAPSRTKSGGVLKDNGRQDATALPISRLQRAREQRIAGESPSSTRKEAAQSTLKHDDNVMVSPSGRRRRGMDKEMALKRNAARRQKSSDMLGAMRDATRQAPARSKSSAAAFERKPPSRSKSGAGTSGAGGNGIGNLLGDAPPARRPPPRTKSSDGRQRNSLRTAPVRRAPDRTKSGGILLPTQEEGEEE